MERDKFGFPQRCGASQTAVSPRCRSSLTRLVLQIQSAHVSRTVSWSATFLLILVSLGLAGCGVSVPGVPSKTSGAGSLSVSSTSVSFGAVTVGNTAAATVTVTNTGTAALQVSQAQVTGTYFSLTGATAPLTLAAGSSATVTVDFAPKVAGAAAGTLSLTTPNATTSIALSGNGTLAEMPGLTLSTTSMAFGTATINTPVSESVTMTSSGTAPLTISSATMTGSGFSMSSLALPLTLNPGQSASLTLTFDPGNAGQFNGALTLATNTSDGVATIQMSGTGSTIQSILGDFTCDSDNLVGQGTENCTITLNSPADTGGLSVGLSSSSTAITVPSVMTMPQGTTSGTFSLSYYPVANAQTVTLTASTNNSHKQHNLNVSASTPGLKINPTSVSFGNVKLNSTASQAITLTSSGTSALTISAAAVTGTGYGISGMALPLTLNPGQTANLTVSFNPSTAGTVTGAVNLTTNASTANIALSGTGQAAGTLSALSCQSSSMTGAGNDACTVSLTSAAPSGGLTVTLSSNNSAVAVPGSVVVPAGASSVAFTAAVSSVTTAQTATLTAQSGGVTATFAIGLGAAITPALSAVSCANNSITGSSSDVCSVSLTAAAGTGGLSVGLTSSNTAVVVPTSVLVPAGAKSAGFTATVSSVTTAQTATLTAQAGGVTATFGISLGAAVPGLTLASTSVAFGNVNLNTPSTQQVVLTSSGTAPVTISAASVTGTGFTISGLSLPLTLNPGGTAVLNITFDPTTANPASGAVTLTTNATPATASIALTGAGQTTSYEVDLTWSAPSSSSDPVAGYHVYRSTNGGPSQLVTSSLDSSTAYADSTVVSGSTYTYYVVSVDNAGTESTPSNNWQTAIP